VDIWVPAHEIAIMCLTPDRFTVNPVTLPPEHVRLRHSLSQLTQCLRQCMHARNAPAGLVLLLNRLFWPGAFTQACRVMSR
jgi:hypothetical protein